MIKLEVINWKRKYEFFYLVGNIPIVCGKGLKWIDENTAQIE